MLAVFDLFQEDEDANTLQQADILFEMYIRMEYMLTILIDS